MIATSNQNYFVLAAKVSAELHRAMIIAKDIALTASNARALAMRAGKGAAGFRAITDFIDELAKITVNASHAINKLAISTSRNASDTARAETALAIFESALEKGKGAAHLSSVQPRIQITQQYYGECERHFEDGVLALETQLNELSRELRTATVLAAMSRVEASQAGKAFEEPLNIVAENVAHAAENIQAHVKRSQEMIRSISTSHSLRHAM